MARIGASVDIQVAKNKDWKTEKLYPYKAVAIIDQENKVDIGLISPASIEAYGKTLETGKMFANLKSLSNSSIYQRLEVRIRFLGLSIHLSSLFIAGHH
jgi:hypothetical protein